MAQPVTDIPNLGPASAEAFARAGITSADEIRALGADEAYLRLLRSGSPPHFIGYYVLVMGLQGRPWNDCKGKEKTALRRRFDALKAQVKANPGEALGRARIEAAMNEIGLIERPD
ncbi:MAG: TfoX/Sxy family protein [Paracoccaceae bacterium]